MAEKIRIETFGNLAKEENLVSLNDNILPNTLVLESMEPFPGYHGSLPTEPVPNWLFFITAKEYSIERVIRTTKEIKTYYPHDFNATIGKICVRNTTYPCIRIRGLQSFDHIKDLQSSFLDADIQFVKKKKINETAIIKIKKVFYLEPVHENLYKDIEDEFMFYFKLPVQIKWGMFSQITRKIKNNIENNNFDAALGAIYVDGVIDVVRIYAKDLPADRLEILREKYVQEIHNTLKY